jgi:hypothetical protein
MFRRAHAYRIVLALVITACVAIVVFELNLLRAAGPIPVTYIPHGDFVKNGQFPSTYALGVSGVRWGSWDGDDAKTGTLTTSLFRAPIALTLEIAGGTARPNERIDLVSADHGSRISLSTPTDAGETFIPATRILPMSWWGRPIRLEMTDAPGSAPRSWIAVADLRGSTFSDLIAVPMIWFSNQELLYKVIAGLFIAIMVLTALRLPAERGVWTSRDTLFLCAVALTLVWMRWPIDAINGELNIDEARTTAQALRVAFDGVPWKGFDPATGGPLNIYLLATPLLFRLIPSFISTHIIGTIIIFLTATFIYAAARTVWGGKIGSCSALVYTLFEALSHNSDFLHTSSELLPNALLAACAWAAATIYSPERGDPRPAVAAIVGILAGALPFAKLQSTPSAIVVWAAVLALLITARRPKAIVALLCGSIVVPILLIGLAAVTGAFRDFYVSYILQNTAYASSGFPTNPVAFLFATDGRFSLLLECLIVFILAIAVFCAFRRRKPMSAELVLLAFLALLFATCLYEIVKPGRGFTHYLALMAVPVSFVAGAAAAILRSAISRETPVRSVPPIISLSCAILIFVAPQVYMEVTEPEYYLHGIMVNTLYRGDAISSEISQIVGVNSPVAIWGWRPEPWVFSQTVMATRDGDTSFQIEAGPYQQYYQDRYLDDIEDNPPKLFIDAVAPNSFYFTNRTTEGLESFPALHDFIERSYTLRIEIDGVRFFVRRTDAARNRSGTHGLTLGIRLYNRIASDVNASS